MFATAALTLTLLSEAPAAPLPSRLLQCRSRVIGDPGPDAGWHNYAVVSDTGLDALSPWPKSRHDVRNTGDASAPLP